MFKTPGPRQYTLTLEETKVAKANRITLKCLVKATCGPKEKRKRKKE